MRTVENNHINQNPWEESFQNTLLYTQRFQSKKAQIETHMSSMGILDGIAIPRSIFSIHQTQDIYEDMIDGITHGCAVGLRSCYQDRSHPNAAWFMNIKTHEDVEEKMEHLSSWQKQGTTEVIVMHNPPELDGKKKTPNSFVARTEVSNEVMLIEARFGTHQLRDAEGHIPLNELTRITLHGPYIQSHFGIVDLMQITPTDTGAFFSEDKYPYEEYMHVLRQTRPHIAYVVQTVLSYFTNPQYELRDKWEILQRNGLEILEWQGIVGKWMNVYGLRGTRDEYNWHWKISHEENGYPFPRK